VSVLYLGYRLRDIRVCCRGWKSLTAFCRPIGGYPAIST